ncbi:caspase-2-like [Pomacea canaliculata]|uniref:caspase-2-like n=1 Tax=Pomacea canaliculata TaxID=400727 RepID=UPI000D73BA17|nr:caspase-2-like [Pomacea canaliculata]
MNNCCAFFINHNTSKRQKQRMEKAHKDMLIEHRTKLVKTIDIANGLFSELIQRKVLTPRMVREIKVNKDIDSQIEDLLDLLPSCGPEAYDQFCAALVASDQKYIVDFFLDMSPSKPTSEKAPSPCTVASIKSDSSTLSAIHK